jgi:hypothetical protein
MVALEKCELAQPTISETIEAVQVGGRMLFEGYKASWEVMKQPPYLLPIEELATLVRERSGFDNLREGQKVQLLIGFARIYDVMRQRAALREEWSGHLGMGEAIGQALNRNLPLEDQINPKKLGIHWGLLSIVLLAKGKTYDQLSRVVAGKGGSVGFLNWYKDPHLGYISVVKQLTYPNTNLTTHHEDDHAFQQESDDNPVVPDIRPLIGSEAMLRLVEGHFRPEDVAVARQAIDAIFEAAQIIIDTEFAPSLWSHQYVDLGVVAEYLKPMNVITVAMDNIASFLSEDKEKLLLHLYPRLKQVEIDYYLRFHTELVKAALKEYTTGDGLGWEWVASRASALPVRSSLRLKVRVLLEKWREFEAPDPVWSDALAQALVVFASRKVDPEVFDRSHGRAVLASECIASYQEVLAASLADFPLYEYLIADRCPLAPQWGELKAEVVKKAAGVVPAGFRRSFKNELARKLDPIASP